MASAANGGVLDGVEHGQAEVGGAALAGGDAADVVGAVLEPLLGVEGAVFTGDTLGDDLGVFSDENGHGFVFLVSGNYLTAPAAGATFGAAAD
jgi:hypothetical protein